VAEYTTEIARLLVVSRESAVLRPLWAIAEPNSWQVEVAASAWDAIERVQSGLAPHLLVLDLPRGDGDGLHILRWLRRLRPDLPVVVTCCPEDAERRKEITRLGAQEVLVRPFDDARLESVICRHLSPLANTQGEIASEDIEQVGPDVFFVSASPITQRLRAQIHLLAEADVPVLMLGEPGSGKDAVARLIHKLSVRSGFRFLKVNCADMPGELLEAELFGTGGPLSPGGGWLSSGKLERAEKGTIFLEEIAEMPLSLQERLVQILQDKVLLNEGSNKKAPVDVRILAGTSASIDRALSERKLREDLYYRLSAFTVQVPPLRQRKSELTILLRHTMHQLAKHYGLPPRDFSSAVLAGCQQHSWPGNLKELESFVKRYLVSGDMELAFNDLPLKSKVADGRNEASAHQITVGFGRVNGEPDQSSAKSLKSLIQDVKSETERNAIATALKKTGWNRKAAARLLQVSYRTLLYKIEQYHMTSSDTFLSLRAGKLSLQNATSQSNGKES
jgi:two-component system, NtrC family, response regulator AtoC